MSDLVKNRWVIWSEEHGKWWCPGRWGYTDQLAKAGRYTEAEARQIEHQANIGSQFKEVAMPDPCNQAFWTRVGSA